MPKVTIWIREGEDIEIWEQIEDIPTFLHECLQMQKEAWEAAEQNDRNAK